jgi:hypothetical protein
LSSKSIVAAALPLVAAPLSLPEILAKLDQNAATFRAMTAKLERIDYTAVLKDASKESGTILMMKKKSGSVSRVVWGIFPVSTPSTSLPPDRVN